MIATSIIFLFSVTIAIQILDFLHWSCIFFFHFFPPIFKNCIFLYCWGNLSTSSPNTLQFSIYFLFCILNVLMFIFLFSEYFFLWHSLFVNGYKMFPYLLEDITSFFSSLLLYTVFVFPCCLFLEVALNLVFYSRTFYQYLVLLDYMLIFNNGTLKKHIDSSVLIDRVWQLWSPLYSNSKFAF